MLQISKTVNEQYPLDLTYNNIPTGLAIASATATAIDLSDAGSDATTIILTSGTLVVRQNTIQLLLQGGDVAHRYQITLIILLTPGIPTTTIQDDLILLVT